MGACCASSAAPANQKDAKATATQGDATGSETSPAAVAKAKLKKQATEENSAYMDTMKFLGKVPLFKRLPKDQHPILASACVNTNYEAKQTIIKQGEDGTEFFIIRSGEAIVEVSGGKIATLKAGDYFGENALLKDEPRSATIIAEKPIQALKITREKFEELGLRDKIVFANRKAVAAGGATRRVKQKEPSPKTAEDKMVIGTALRSNENLQTMVTLDDERVGALMDVAWKETVTKGTEVITEGDLNADYFYIVQEGEFDVQVRQVEDEMTQSAEKAISSSKKYSSTIGPGGSFGELALLYLVPRAATVTAKSDAVLWVIDRLKFKEILLKVSDKKLKEYEEILGRVELLGSLIDEEKKALAKGLVEMHFQKDEIILQQGEPGNTFYILYAGEVQVIKDGAKVASLTASANRATAQFFGERALLSNEERKATVQVTSTTAKALALDRESFEVLLGPLSEIMKSQENGKDKGHRASFVGAGKGLLRSVNPNDKPRDRILRKDLKKIGLLGCGGFGAVELWEHKTTANTYAMKALSKGFVVKMGMQDSVMNEKSILMMTNSPFIIKLYECYNGSQHLFFLLEPALGGEIYAIYNRKNLHGREKHCKCYCAGTLMAFEHLHERHIIYRDLKPENLLLNDVGHIKLTDMGLAKFVIGKTYTTCGTPDYFAPELIASTGHTTAVDWWTLGILMFELMCGHPPFESPYPMQIYSKVMRGVNKVPWPPKCQGLVSDLIKGLLKKEPSERLPMRPGGTKNVKEVKWYADFEWQALQNGNMEWPHKPVVKSKKDIANFSARKEDIPQMLEYKDDGSGWDKDFAT